MNRQEILNTKKEFIKSPRFEDNIDKYGYNSNTCICCGRQLKDKTNAVITIEGPMVIEAHITEEQIDAAGLVSQGVFYLGSTCIKKYPKKYRRKL